MYPVIITTDTRCKDTSTACCVLGVIMDMHICGNKHGCQDIWVDCGEG